MTTSSRAVSIHPGDLRRYLRDLLDSGQFGVLDAAGGYLLLARGSGGADIPDAFYDFARVDPETFQPPICCRHPVRRRSAFPGL